MVRVDNLCVRLGDHVVLSDVSFDINHGEIAAVIGPNGSGKTTLIRAILGLIPLEKGTVNLDTDQIGYLPQRFPIDPEFPITVFEFLELTKKDKHHANLTTKLEEVGLTPAILKKRLGSLSGGQLQRVLIAQATIHNPPLLILDEPSTGIDIVGEKQFYDLIRCQRDNHGTTVILVSHDLSVIANVVDQIVCVNKRLVCFGPPKKALTQETIFELYGGADKGIYHHHHTST